VAGVSAGVLLGGVAQAAPPTSPGSAGTGTLAPFTASGVASVAVNGETNPYSLAVVPLSAGKLIAGNVLVVDFNHGATPGAGTTILQVNPTTGVSSVFASGVPISGPVGIAINPVNDGVWVGGFGATDGSTSNDLLILPDGTVKANYNAATVNAKPGYTGMKPTFDGVWGEGVSKHAGQVSFYYGTTGSGAAGTGGGQVWRIDPHPTGTANGQPVNSTYAQIATGLGDNATTKALPVTAANAAGPQGFAYNDATGVMYVSNDADNTITVIPDAATATGPTTTTIVPVAAGVLNTPENIALNPVNGDLYVVNAATNTLTEINPATGAVLGSRVLDGGAPGALFGLAVTVDATNSPVIFYGNDNDNTLNKLAIAPAVVTTTPTPVPTTATPVPTTATPVPTTATGVAVAPTGTTAPRVSGIVTPIGGVATGAGGTASSRDTTPLLIDGGVALAAAGAAAAAVARRRRRTARDLT
jgi:hypothetical protein